MKKEGEFRREASESGKPPAITLGTGACGRKWGRLPGGSAVPNIKEKRQREGGRPETQQKESVFCPPDGDKRSEPLETTRRKRKLRGEKRVP